MSRFQFPEEYLEGLAQNHKQKVEEILNPAERLLMYSGARLNWVGEYVNDKSIDWKLETIPVDTLTLTGTGPEWNAIILDQAGGSPVKFRELLKKREVRHIFELSQYVDIPILVRFEDLKYKILDGMNRTIAAIRDDITEIRAYIGSRNSEPKPIIESHVIYDFIKAYQQRGGNENDFKGALRFLINAYSNTRELLETRFNSKWVRDEKIQKIIKSVLESY